MRLINRLTISGYEPWTNPVIFGEISQFSSTEMCPRSMSTWPPAHFFVRRRIPHVLAWNMLKTLIWIGVRDKSWLASFICQWKIKNAWFPIVSRRFFPSFPFIFSKFSQLTPWQSLAQAVGATSIAAEGARLRSDGFWWWNSYGMLWW